MAGSGFGDVMSNWGLGVAPGNAQASAGQGAAEQGAGPNLLHRSELVPIDQTLMSPALAHAFAIPSTGVPLSDDGCVPPGQDLRPGEEATRSGGLPMSVQANSADAWTPNPGVSQRFFPGGLMGVPPAGDRGCGPGCNPQMPQMSLPLPLGMAAVGGQVGLPGLALMPQGPQDGIQQGGWDAMQALRTEPAAQWKGLTCLAAGQEQQLQLQQQLHQQLQLQEQQQQQQRQLQQQQQQQQLQLQQQQQQQQLRLQQQQQQQQLWGVDEKPQRRTRVFWTTDLKKRFENAVKELGLDHATPKQILKLMLVEGLTRENVASHLQKFRVKHKKPEGQSRHKKSSSGLAGSVAGNPEGDKGMNDETGDEEEPEASESTQDGEQEGMSACSIPPARSDRMKDIAPEAMNKDGCA
ncbi:unnamed protein product [Ostreobium quekettii]|uniref:HTH myb-type domain-containing protein n=1 Tax=Ostreobium quekettii TaxID=121088 RepID=A0A8S1ILH7_9CHLO|nr:unnamed protein product [Ostreobium quekettii]|eukprot:evm.model.scf_162EXC.13 EVM.evm.TU.scf_162EXC.13   scf_162EXC:90994-92217(-)